MLALSGNILYYILNRYRYFSCFLQMLCTFLIVFCPGFIILIIIHLFYFYLFILYPRSFKCGGILMGASGYIGSEGFPGVYPPNSKCTWKITVPEGKVVVLSFRFIDLESDNLCRYDFVDVYNGHTNGQRLGRFCGTLRPGALVANSNKMLVQMISDANTAGNGFVAKFSAAEPHERALCCIFAGDQYCGGRLNKPSGSFKTPNWPDRDYPAGVTCSWHIVAPKNQLIELNFEKFDVERDNYCRYDYVAVFNGGEINDARRIGKYCGDSPPAPITSERNELLVQFLSDLSLTADGFIGHYKFRPKRIPTTTSPTTARTLPATTTLKPTVALCQQKCRRSGTLESNYCSSNFDHLSAIWASPIVFYPFLLLELFVIVSLTFPALKIPTCLGLLLGLPWTT
ncbi:procollagen C-endopeptidase enhancer 2 isoform X5 [Varanus komodoensis]|uniref:procollagen C-endopeptidase enhancer 2 isoform X5 n=1 Tax=Varanus komodoensis TaxID=61221 RepID=UPI001CF7B355|nr:procollagen C-endopeptidase enhancer 2 isoform X5 [Varanus komodoensis]